MTALHTPQGDVTLLSPPVELLRAIRSFLPFGAVRYNSPLQGADFGLVMQCGEQEVYGVKQQAMECDEKQSRVAYQANTILIAHSLGDYLKNGFSGLFMPCGYIRTKEGGVFESGIAYFGYPSPHGRESQEYAYEAAYDRQFEHGFATMMTSFIRSLR
jgi:hypothetical protein